MVPVGKFSTCRTSGPRNRAASARNVVSSSPVDSKRCTGGVVAARSSPWRDERAVDVGGGLLGAGHQPHLRTHHVLDRRRHQRVVRAAEHEGVDVRLDERREVLLRRPRTARARSSSPASTNSTNRGQAVVNRSSPDAAANASSYARDRMVPVGADDADPTVAGRAHRRAHGRLDHLDHRDAVLDRVALARIPEHRRRRRVAGDDEGLHALPDQVVHAPAAHRRAPRRSASGRRASAPCRRRRGSTRAAADRGSPARR